MIADVRQWMARARQGMQLEQCGRCGGAVRAPGWQRPDGTTERDVFTMSGATTIYLGQCDDCHEHYAWPNGRDLADVTRAAREQPRQPVQQAL